MSPCMKWVAVKDGGPIFCVVKATYLRSILGDSWHLGPGFRGLLVEILEENPGKFWKIWGGDPHGLIFMAWGGGVWRRSDLGTYMA